MLEIKDINVFYGAIQALTNVSINVQKGEVVAIIGSNGAGKSTLLRTISGMIRPRTGSMIFEGKNLVAEPTFVRTRTFIGTWMPSLPASLD